MSVAKVLVVGDAKKAEKAVVAGCHVAVWTEKSVGSSWYCDQVSETARRSAAQHGTSGLCRN